MTNTDLMNVSAFKGKAPSTAFATLNPQTESLADGIGSSYGVVHYRGKVWSLRHRGETYVFTRADDGSPLAFLDVIILRQLPAKSKSYYPKGSWDEGVTGARPICSALDGVTPDVDVQQRQANACAVCPRNEWKVNAEGRKGRECSDYKRLAVLILPNLTKAILGAPLMEPVFLRIPAASLNDLAQMGESMSAQGWHYSSFITRIGFVPDKAHPQMTFKALQELTEKEAPIVLPMREEPMTLRITGESEIGKPRPQIAVDPVAQQQRPSAQATTALNADGNIERNSPHLAKPTVPPQNNLILDLQANAPDEVVDAGFGAVTEQPKAAASNVVQMAPVGETAESDDDLDARVRDLLKTS